MPHGIVGHIGIGKETAFGSGVAVTDYIEALSENLTLAIDRYEIKNIVGRYSEPDDMAGMKRNGGDIVFPADPVFMGHVLRGTHNVMSGSVVLSGFLFKNEFTLGATDFSSDSPFQPYTFEIFRDVTSSQRYTSGVFNRLQFSIQPNQDLRVTANILAKGTSEIAKTSPSFTSSPQYPFAFDTASISIAGAGSSMIEALTVTIDNQLEGIAVLNNSTEIARVRRSGFQTVRIGGTIGFDNLTEYAVFKAQTEQRFLVNFTRASSFNLTLDMPKVVYTAFPLGIPGRTRLTVGFEGMARYHAGSLTAIKIDLTSTKSNY